ncbi:hypothetical protein Celaphus_00016377 [Cervus elaphus hippelaphus]|uniref:Uncharacterized protein n=1 Tax=Cervus elaphus hippelaphus TaxID=46360 RepID=A0A212CEN9_CEREH|nr:hypothetical protein Celaphus_00016377 [Cervus elaphus hippelaphus]
MYLTCGTGSCSCRLTNGSDPTFDGMCILQSSVSLPLNTVSSACPQMMPDLETLLAPACHTFSCFRGPTQQIFTELQRTPCPESSADGGRTPVRPLRPSVCRE